MDEQKTKDLILNSMKSGKCEAELKLQRRKKQVTIDFAFATVCTIKPIKKGEPFTMDNI
jgi:N-acetylneuraminate synthase